MGHRTVIARYVAKWRIAKMCLCGPKCQGGDIAPFWWSAKLEVSPHMGYRSGSVANGAALYRSTKPPSPPKCSGECSRRCRPETGCSGKCSEKCLSSLFLEETPGTSTFPSPSPSTPFLAGTSSSALPSTLGGWGVLRFCRGPPRSQRFGHESHTHGLRDLVWRQLPEAPPNSESPVLYQVNFCL